MLFLPLGEKVRMRASPKPDSLFHPEFLHCEGKRSG
jgi:hypothetical protein